MLLHTATPLEAKPAMDHRSILNDVDALLGINGPPDRFLGEMLALQCRLVQAEGGMVLRPGEKNRFEILAMHALSKNGTSPANWAARAKALCPETLACGASIIRSVCLPHLPNDADAYHLILIPILRNQQVRGIGSYLVHSNQAGDLERCRDQLEATAYLLNTYEMRWTLRARRTAMDRMRSAIEVLAEVNGSDRFLAAAMALCNETATRWRCSRVSVGFLKGRYVHVRAMSHTDRFNRKMRLLQDIETTMEECLDQDLEVIYPAHETASYVSRAAAHLSTAHGPAALLSLPIRHNGDVPAVILLERPQEQPFDDPEEVEAIRLACDLCATRLVELHLSDRWFGARLAGAAKNGLASIFGPSHTWIKLGALAVMAAAVFLAQAQGNHRIEAPFAFEAPVHQAVVAPFKTYLKSVAVMPGDPVEAGQTVLGELETSELRLQLAALKAEQLGFFKQMAAGMRDGKTADAQIAQAQIDKLAADIRLLESHVTHATLVAPITGTVVSEDLQPKLGAPVETGTVLFEIAQIASLRAELHVPEAEISDLKIGQTGELVSVGHPEQRIPFRIAQINPVADVIENQNVFRVWVELQRQSDWMRPGMKGVAKVHVGRRHLVWIATHRLIDWIRVKLWL